MSFFRKLSNTFGGGVKNTGVGLDIADHTIELLEVKRMKGELVVANLARTVLERGIIEKGRIKNPDVLREVLQKTFREAKPEAIKTDHVIFGVPERHLFTHSFTLSKRAYDESAKKKTLKVLIQKTAEQHIPLEASNLVLSHKVYKRGDQMQIFIIATEREVLMEWRDFLATVPIDTIVFDIEPLATFRGIFPNLPKEPVCIIDIGAVTTDVALFDHEGLRESYILSYAGDAITNAIAEGEKVSFDEAETMKKELGLLGENKRLEKAITNVLDNLVRDAVDTIAFFERIHEQSVAEIVVVGGGSRLHGLLEYLTGKISTPLRLGRIPSQIQGQTLDFHTEALGLAMRDVEALWQRRDPLFDLREEEKKKEKKKKEGVVPTSLLKKKKSKI